MIYYITIKELIDKNIYKRNRKINININDKKILSQFLDLVIKNLPTTDLIIDFNSCEIVIGKRIIQLLGLFINNEIILSDSNNIDIILRNSTFSDLSQYNRKKILNYCIRVIYVEKKNIKYYNIYKM